MKQYNVVCYQLLGTEVVIRRHTTTLYNFIHCTLHSKIAVMYFVKLAASTRGAGERGAGERGGRRTRGQQHTRWENLIIRRGTIRKKKRSKH